jgi:hypothetical protein
MTAMVRPRLATPVDGSILRQPPRSGGEMEQPAHGKDDEPGIPANPAAQGEGLRAGTAADRGAR